MTHIATGALGTAAYARSGQLRRPETRRMAGILAAAAAVATPVGVLVNTHVSKQVFGVLLGLMLLVVAGLVVYRERQVADGERTRPPLPLATAIGLFVGVAAGIVGIGGPMLTVPLLVVAGVPVLESLAAAQAQSVVIAGAGTVGYLLSGSIDWPLAAPVGIPELAGVLLGWRIAHALPTRSLKYLLVWALLALAPYLVLHG